MTYRKQKDVNSVIFAILMIALVIAVIVIAVKLNDQITTEKLSSNSYSIGTLDDEGRAVTSKDQLYTKSYISIDGLEIKLDEEADIQYKLFFYDEEKELVSASAEWLKADFDGEIPATAEFVRIVIDPIDDAEISVFEIAGYADQLVVTHNK